jgi:hypothetical protein
MDKSIDNSANAANLIHRQIKLAQGCVSSIPRSDFTRLDPSSPNGELPACNWKHSIKGLGEE